MKICTNCHIKKKFYEYNKNKDNPDGFQNRCRECQKGDYKDWYEKSTPVVSIEKTDKPEKIIKKMIKKCKIKPVSKMHCEKCNAPKAERYIHPDFDAMPTYVLAVCGDCE